MQPKTKLEQLQNTITLVFAVHFQYYNTFILRAILVTGLSLNAVQGTYQVPYSLGPEDFVYVHIFEVPYLPSSLVGRGNFLER